MSSAKPQKIGKKDRPMPCSRYEETHLRDVSSMTKSIKRVLPPVMYDAMLHVLGKSPAKLQKKYANHAHEQAFDWKWDRFNRVALVNFLLSKVGGYDSHYLEIGCFNNALFDAVPCRHKVGVDPERGGNFRGTSDAFFAQNDQKFDVIFIDGLHQYHQVHQDAVNAINCIKKGGWIAFHDFLPRNWREQHIPPVQPIWTGDSWKVGVELANSQGLDFKIFKIDYGVGVMQMTDDKPVIADMHASLSEAQYERFVQELPNLPVVEWQEGIEWINAH
jgi:hypothetical protein